MTEQLYRWHWRARMPERQGELYRLVLRGNVHELLPDSYRDAD